MPMEAEEGLMELAMQRQKEGRVWSLDNMMAHLSPDEPRRSVRVIGAVDNGASLFIYYVDEAGDFWYKNARGYQPPKHRR